MKSLGIVTALFLSLVAVSLPAWAKKPSEYPACSTRTPVAIDRFKTEDISLGWWNEEVAYNSREVAVDELVNSGCFTVLEREDKAGAPEGVMNEKGLARSDEAVPGAKSAKKHQMKTADTLISYALTSAKKNDSGIGGGGGGWGSGGWGGGAFGVKTSTLNLTCKAINVSTSEILASSRVEAKDTGFAVAGAGGGAQGLGGLGYFKDSDLGKMMSKAVHECSVKMAQAVAH